MHNYKVEIERKLAGRFDAKYRWGVTVEKNGEIAWELRASGYEYTINKCKKHALKHILKCEKLIGRGEQFGVVFEISGDAEQVTQALKEKTDGKAYDTTS